MSDLSVLRVQSLLRESAEQGHDLLLPHALVGVHGRSYPTMFKGLDIGERNSSWTTYSAIPFENASVSHIHKNSDGSMYALDLIPHMTSVASYSGSGVYRPNSLGEYYIGANTHSHLREEAGRQDTRWIEAGGSTKPYFDEKGDLVSDIHSHLRQTSKMRSRGVVDDMNSRTSRAMTQEELQIHKRLSSPGKGIGAAPLNSSRTAPMGVIAINHYTGRHLETPGLVQYLYHPTSESLIKV